MSVITALVRKNKSDKNIKKKNNEDENKNQVERKPWQNKNNIKNNDTSGKKIITNIIMIIIKM